MKKEYVHNSDLNLELLIMTEIMKLESLHYGYWKTNGTLNLETIREAQKRYTQTLINLVPQDVNSVLDIGCGIGDNALAFANNGYRVTAISPDENHERFFEKHPNSVKFIKSSIEELNINDKFNMVLMSESQNYFGIDAGLRQTNKYLTDDGYLLISGNFRKKNHNTYDTIHMEEKYISKAQDYGLEVVKRLDITENVLPTLKYTRDLFNNHLLPILNVISKYAHRELPIRTKLAKFFLGDQINKVHGILDYYSDFLDIDNYKENVSYLRILMKKK